MYYSNLSKYILTILLSLINCYAFSQNKKSIEGIILDEKTNKSLPGASVVINHGELGTTSDGYGRVLFSTQKDSLFLQVSFIGYKTIFDTIKVKEGVMLTYKMEHIAYNEKEVVIKDKKVSDQITSVSPSSFEVKMKEMEKLPSIMGEADIMRAVQLSAGVQTPTDGNSGFNVRGGGVDQNLILLDGTPVYNPSHVLGFFSVFNSDAIDNTKLIKSGMPAQYGGRMSSVLTINSKDGSFNKYNMSGNIGLISSKVMVNGPIIKDKVSFILSYRRSYIDQAIKPLAKKLVEEDSSSIFLSSKYYFQDFNAKISYRISSKDLFTLTIYHGADDFVLAPSNVNYKNNMAWGNFLISSTYKRVFENKWLLKTTLGYTNYDFNFAASQYNVDIGLNSQVKDITLKTSVQKQSPFYVMASGIELHKYRFMPNNLDAVINKQNLDFGLNNTLYSGEMAFFSDWEYDLSPKLALNTGLRYSIYTQTGPYSVDSGSYARNEIVTWYHGLEPRISGRYTLNNTSSVKLSYTRHKQYIHLASPSTVTLPTDVWLPSTKGIYPQKSNHFNLGYYLVTPDNQLSGSVEIFYKDFDNQIELLDGLINDFSDNTFEKSILHGISYSYGADMTVRKHKGNWTGWISYTLSKTERLFDEINDGDYYPAKYDRTHDGKLVVMYTHNKFIFSGTFIYATGNTFTVPEYLYLMEGNVLSGFDQINNFRMPAYHRLDLSFDYIIKKTEHYESKVNFSVFNAYNRKNPFYIYFEIEGDLKDEKRVKATPRQVSILPIMPSVSYSIKFK